MPCCRRFAALAEDEAAIHDIEKDHDGFIDTTDFANVDVLACRSCESYDIYSVFSLSFFDLPRIIFTVLSSRLEYSKTAKIKGIDFLQLLRK